MNVGFFLMGAVGLGLLALNLHETFARSRTDVAVVQTAVPRIEPVPVVIAPVEQVPAAVAGMDLASFEALARQLQTLGENIAALLAQWSEGTGNGVQALETRMLAMETEFSRLRVDLDAMGASFQVDAEAYAMADAGDTAPPADAVALADAGAVSNPMPFDATRSEADIGPDVAIPGDPESSAGFRGTSAC